MNTLVSRPSGTRERLRAARAHADGRDYHQPVRKVITRSTARILYELCSVKMRCKVPCESFIEFDHYSVLDVRRDVAAFHAQPELLHYRDHEGKARIHFPDVRVVFTSGAEQFHEVKPDDVAADPVVKSLHEAVADEYSRRSQQYRVVVESEVRRQPRLANAHLLRSTRQRRIVAADLACARSRLAAGPVVLGELVDVLGGGVEARLGLLAMVLRGYLEMDWETLPIDADIPVRLPEAVR